MTKSEWDSFSDEALAAKCSLHIDGAERELLNRYMQAIYWLPQRSFGAAEEELSGFLIYAVEEIRKRHLFSRFDIEIGATFATWFGVVIRNLYLDYLRLDKHQPSYLEMAEEPATPDVNKEIKEEQTKPAQLLEKMNIKCRTLFKMLLANTFFFTAEELRWIAGKSKRNLVEVITLLAKSEEELREADIKLEERQQKLTVVYWWKRLYERKFYQLEKKYTGGGYGEADALTAAYKKLEKRRAQHQKILTDLSGSASLPTTPYQTLAEILRLNKGTLGSQITRCRQAMTAFNQGDDKPETKGLING